MSVVDSALDVLNVLDGESGGSYHSSCAVGGGQYSTLLLNVERLDAV